MESNRMSATIAWSVITFIAGGIFGFFVNDHFLGKTYKKAIKLEREENARLSEENRAISKKRTEALNLAEKRADEPLDSLRHKPDYRELSKKYRDPNEGKPMGEPETDEGPEDDLPLRSPFVISEADLNSGFKDSENIELRYYQADKVLTDDYDEVIEKQKETLSGPIMKILATTTEDIVRVHHDEHDTNYIITIEHTVNYKRDVLGIDDEELEGHHDSEDDNEDDEEDYDE